jgi:hypothetical protein
MRIFREVLFGERGDQVAVLDLLSGSRLLRSALKRGAEVELLDWITATFFGVQ